jgi:hypothetical protein
LVLTRAGGVHGGGVERAGGEVDHGRGILPGPPPCTSS